MQSEGLRWTRLDLHVHTPASNCYECKEDAPQQIVEAALKQGLGAIAITDHNSPDWIDRIKAAAEGSTLVVFPGVEISLTDGFHLLALFDPSKNRDWVVGFLGAVSIDPHSFGKEGVLCDQGVSVVLDKMHDDWKGLAVLAHIDSPKGAFIAKTGTYEDGRIRVPDTCYRFFNDARYDAVETGNGALPLGFDGEHHFDRFPAAYKASDNPSPTSPGKHSKDGIGSQYSWFKLDEITLEGLRQCFIDPSTRICNSEACPVFSAPWIESVGFEGGFFDGQVCRFTRGFNALIGTQGAGKSLIIEFLRFGLQQMCDHDALRSDICGKLREQLGPGGRVRTTVNVDGQRYTIVRTLPASFPKTLSRCWEPICDSLPTVTREDGQVVNVRPRDLFPVQAYSQGEVVLIAREAGAQLRLIDESLDLSSQHHKLRSIVEETLRPNTEELAAVVTAGSGIDALNSQIAVQEESIRSLQKKLESEWFQTIENWRRANAEAKGYLEYIADLESQVAVWHQQFGDEEEQPEVRPAELDDFPLVAGIAALKKTAVDTTKNALMQLKEGLAGLGQEAQRAMEAWQHEFKRTEKAYAEFLGQAGGEKQELDAQLKTHQDRLTELGDQLRDEERREAQRERLVEARNKALDDFSEVRSEISQLRRSHYEVLSEATSGLLQLRLQERADTSLYLDQIDRLMTGSKMHRSTFESVSRAVAPRELADMVLLDGPTKAAERKSIDGLPKDSLVAILGWLKETPAKAILELPYVAPLEDRPEIKYRVSGRGFVLLEDLSAGQKMTALQMIILSMGQQPVIVDQPEDSIDTASLYHNIVQKIRTGKTNRQFILTSHNPNIVVTSDADRINVLKPAGERGRMAQSGALDRQGVREEAIEHLEGGRESYGIRSAKYGISRPGS